MLLLLCTVRVYACVRVCVCVCVFVYLTVCYLHVWLQCSLMRSPSATELLDHPFCALRKPPRYIRQTVINLLPSTYMV